MLKNNKSELRSQGFNIPPTKSQLDHTGLFLAIRALNYANDEETLETRKGINVNVEQAYKFFRATSKRDLQQSCNEFMSEIHDSIEISRKNCHSTIISCEQLSRLDEKEIRYLLEKIEGLCSQIIVISYLRHPILHVTSSISEKTKSLSRFTREQANRFFYFKNVSRVWKRGSLYNYYGMQTMWQDNNDRVNMRPRLFDPKQLYNNDLIYDFMQAISADYNMLKVEKSQGNISLSKPAIAWLLKYNELVIEGVINEKPQREKLVSYFYNETCKLPKLRPNTEQLNLFETHFSDANEALRREYFPDVKDLWPSTKITSAESFYEQVEVSKSEETLLKMLLERID